MAKGKNTIDMVAPGPIAGRLLAYAVPLILMGMLQLAFNAADVIVVGRYVDDTALAAVGSTGSLINLIVNVFMGLSVGTSVHAAQYFGANDNDRMKKLVHTSILAAIIGGIIVMIIGFFGARFFLTLMKSPHDVIDQATLYLKIYFLGMPGCMLYNFLAAVLRSVGDTKRPLIFLTVSGVVNVVLNLFLVIVVKIGVAGVAVATAVSQYVAAGLIFIFMKKSDECYKISIKDLKIHKEQLLKMLRVGIPAGLQGSVFSISNVIIQSSINSFGSAVMAGNAAASNIEGFVYTAMNAFHHTVLTYTGQNIGAGKPQRISRGLWTCMLLVTCAGLGVGLLIYVFRYPLIGVYMPEATPQAMEAALLRTTIIMLTYTLCGHMEVVNGTLRGMGASIIPMMMSLIGACGLRIVWVYTIFKANPTLLVLYLSYPVSWILTFLAQLIACYIIKRRVTNSMLANMARPDEESIQDVEQNV